MSDIVETKAGSVGNSREADDFREAKAQFLAMMSHEIRTPLNPWQTHEDGGSFCRR